MVELFDFFHSLFLGRSDSPYFAAPPRISILGMTFWALTKSFDNIYLYAVCLGARTRQAFTARRRISISKMTFCSLKKQLSNVYLFLSSVPRALRLAMLHLAHLQPHANKASSGGGSGRGSFIGGGDGGGSSSGGSEVRTHMYMHTGATMTNAEARAQKIEEWRRPKFWAGFLVLGSRTCLPGPANVS